MPPPRQPPRYTNTQPRTYSVGLKALLSLPFRLCNPPPAVGKVRSCGVTPLLKVRLEDVLDRQHLPPLGLKDFEEWLLFVELSPENLCVVYFLPFFPANTAQILHSVAARVQAALHTMAVTDGLPEPRRVLYPPRPVRALLLPSHHVLRPREADLLHPGSAYELNLASTLLAPFHRTNAPPYPPPEDFRAVEIDTYRTLDESLRRFVNAQLNNVGNRRVLCGMIAGVVFSLIGAAIPLAVLFARHDPRLARLAALPGLWLGLTILLASLNGVCLGVYIFGDLRQLRTFELARPPISKPQLLPAYRPIVQAAAAGVLAKHAMRAPSVSSLATHETAFSTAGTNETDDNIHISPAYYDADSIEDMDPMELYAPNPGSMEDLGQDLGRHYHLGSGHDAHEEKPTDSAVDLSTHTPPLRRAPPPTRAPPRPRPTLARARRRRGPSPSPTPSTTSTYTATATFIHAFDAGSARTRRRGRGRRTRRRRSRGGAPPRAAPGRRAVRLRGLPAHPGGGTAGAPPPLPCPVRVRGRAPPAAVTAIGGLLAPAARGGAAPAGARARAGRARRARAHAGKDVRARALAAADGVPRGARARAVLTRGGGDAALEQPVLGPDARRRCAAEAELGVGEDARRGRAHAQRQGRALREWKSSGKEVGRGQRRGSARCGGDCGRCGACRRSRCRWRGFEPGGGARAVGDRGAVGGAGAGARGGGGGALLAVPVV
ncbi:hypothetical protein BJ912DRAFT_1088590 [Pholiota molesta]|nr:hypothetical protein BJ912DRAFT_1088590 [Pholiota molesta]